MSPRKRVGLLGLVTASAITVAALSGSSSAAPGPVVFVANGTSFADQAAAAVKTAELGGNLLLTPPGALPTNVRDEIASEAPSQIVLVGGTSAVSPAVETALRAIAPTTRIAGVDRYETAILVARFVLPASTTTTLPSTTSTSTTLPTTTTRPTTTTSTTLATTTTTPGVVIANGESWQAKIDANPAGTTFTVMAAVYQSQFDITPKTGDVFNCQPGAILDGGKTDTTQRAFRSTQSNVTLRGCEIRYYKTQLQHGAIAGDDFAGTGWVLENLDVHHNYSGGVGIGNGWIMRGGKVHDNGQIGLKASYAVGATYDGVEVYGNHFDPGVPNWHWDPNTQGGNLAETGGSKFSETKDLVVRNMNVHDNDGPGLWTDINNYNVLYENNLVERNVGAGIFHEISFKATIRNNTIRNNGSNGGWIWNGGIQIAASQDVEIYGNTLVDNYNNIVLLQQNRGTGRYPASTGDTTARPYVVRNVHVHDNTTTRGRSTGLAQDTTAVPDLMSPASGNTFVHNAYIGAHPFPGPFSRNGSDGLSWAQWQALGYDTTGSYT